MFVPKKSLGQNFLQDETLARWIAAQIEPDGAPFVVEIGPGRCALTEHLLGRPQRLILIEKDEQLVADLEERLRDEPGVELINADAITMDMRPWYRFGDVRLIGNLPYSVGTAIIRALMTQPTPVTRAVFMLQKEVCQRVSAGVGQHGYSALSLLIQQHWHVEYLRDVPPEVFVPRPRVDSAIVKFTPRDPATLPVFDHSLFRRLVRMGFSQRRKQLHNGLPEVPHGGWEALAAAGGFDPRVRAEALSLEQWVFITRWYDGRFQQTDRGQRGEELFDVVDEHNVVIGQRPRAEVHAQGLRHRAVHVFVFDKQGQVYLQKRSHLKDVHPRVWDSSAAGHLDVGESYAGCAVRELQEEIGVEVQATRKIAEVPACEATGMEFVELHATRYDGRIRYSPDEIECGQWFKPEVITEWIAARPQDFASGFIACWQAAGGTGTKG